MYIVLPMAVSYVAAAEFAHIVHAILAEHTDADVRDFVLFAHADAAELCNKINELKAGAEIGEFTVVDDTDLNPGEFCVHARCLGGAIYDEIISTVKDMDWQAAATMNTHQLAIYLLGFMSDTSIDCTHEKPLEPFKTGERLIELITGDI